MARHRIDFSFSTDGLVAPPAAPRYTRESTEDNDQDTAVLDTDKTHERNMAKLENLRMGHQTVAEVVKGLEIVRGHQLYVARIVEQGGETTRVILEQYPDPRTAAIETNTLYYITDGGEVSTDMVRLPGMGHRGDDSIYTRFNTRFNKPPYVILGLNSLHQFGATRIEGKPEVCDHLFEIKSRAWDTTHNHSAGFTWFAIPSDEHLLLQVGSFVTWEDHPWDERKDLTQRAITFSTPYNSPPKVVVWLNRIDFKAGCNERVTAFATDVTATGFTVHINTWGDTFLHTSRISWFAYPVGTVGIRSGSLQPSKGTSGIITFDEPFARPPRRILVALNKLESDKSYACRFKIIHEAVSERGMAVRVETWGDSKLYTAGVSYIAIQ